MAGLPDMRHDAACMTISPRRRQHFPTQTHATANTPRSAWFMGYTNCPSGITALAGSSYIRGALCANARYVVICGAVPADPDAAIVPQRHPKGDAL